MFHKVLQWAFYDRFSLPSPHENHRRVRKWQNIAGDYCPKMGGSLATGSRPSTSYGPGLQKPVQFMDTGSPLSSWSTSSQ